jgi:hypothetical protein
MKTNEKEKVTKEIIIQVLRSGEEFQFNFSNKDIIVIQRSNKEHFPVKGNID